MKISVIGLGIYSLAISNSLAKNKNNEIVIWTESNEKYKEFKNKRNITSLYDLELPKNITITTNLEETIKDASIIYLITASKYTKDIVEKITPYYNKNIPICIATKGIDESNEEILSNIVLKTLKTKHIAVISGPTFAQDILNNEPIALAIASKSDKAKDMVIKTLKNETLKLRPTKDMIGIQLCGAIKNVIAIGSGIISGLGYSDSTQAFLINESMHDIMKIIYYLGGKPKTILSFAGVGDLMLTCSSKKSRNYSFGYIVGSTKDTKKINKYLENNTVEGYSTLNTVYHMLKRKNIELGIIKIIYDIVYKNESPEKLAKFLIEKK